MAVQSRKFSLLILLTILQGCVCQIDISPKERLVNVGDSVTIMCKINQPVQACSFQFNGEGAAYNINPENPSEKLKYYGAGFEKGECGVTLNRAEEKHNGFVNCTVMSLKFDREARASMKLVIARTPSRPELQFSEFNNKNYYKEGENLLATCTVKNGRPKPNVTVYIGDTVIQDVPRDDYYYSTKDDLHTVIQNISHITVASDDGKMLRCVADHPGLTDANNYAEKRISVNYQPKAMSGPVEHFGLVEGVEGRISVTVQANPKPAFIWSVGTKTLHEGETDGRFSVLRGVEKGNWSWESVLVIDSLTKDDVEEEYKLTASNTVGATNYQVVISTSPRPKVLEIGTGTIIFIVLAVLLLAVVTVTILYARSRGRWCFADPVLPRLTAESSDTESAEHNAPDNSPKRSFASVFKKKSDKVAADMEVLRDVTVDDEKVASFESETSQDLNDINEGVVYAELDLQAHRPGPTVVRGEDEKTEYAEIIHSKPK